MANKKNGTISATNVDKYLKTRPTVEHVEIHYGDGGVLELDIKKVVDTATFSMMVSRAANSVFIENEETGSVEYVPAFESVAVAEAVLTYVANFGDALTTSRVGALMYSPVMKAVEENWDFDQRYAFNEAFRREVDYRCQMMLSAERHRLNLIGEQLERATNAFVQLNGMFEGVESADMNAAIKKLGAMDDNAIVEAVLAVNKEKK